MSVPTLHDPALCHALLDRLQNLLDRPLRFMEVCGTHTVSIFRGGLRTLLPPAVTHLTGPGCPVCVTHDSEVAMFIALAARSDVILATFGDLMRVPDPDGYSLKHAQAQGARVSVVYSPLDALDLAARNPDATVVFLGVGFETTAPAVAATVLMAEQRKLNNFLVFACHKLVPPALEALLADAENSIDAFLLPGHVSTVLGLLPYTFVSAQWHRPAVVAGFEPADILDALCRMAQQYRTGVFQVENAYPRAVNAEGNPKARAIMHQVFRVSDARWRGLGEIPNSGLAFNPAYERFDAVARLGLVLPDVSPIPGCRCGEILKGKRQPAECPLFGKACTPANPIGPCMVSTEGSCAAYYRYGV
ncbi:MAG: hydrogenase formation protein HypD [Bilophila sp.]